MANILTGASIPMPNGCTFFTVDALPSSANDGINFVVGDMLLNVGTSPGLYKCTTAGTGASAVFTGPL